MSFEPIKGDIDAIRERLDDYMIEKDAREFEAFEERAEKMEQCFMERYFMTNEELIEELQKYPKEAKVHVIIPMKNIMSGEHLSTGHDAIGNVCLTDLGIEIQTQGWLEWIYDRKHKK